MIKDEHINNFYTNATAALGTLIRRALFPTTTFTLLNLKEFRRIELSAAPD